MENNAIAVRAPPHSAATTRGARASGDCGRRRRLALVDCCTICERPGLHTQSVATVAIGQTPRSSHTAKMLARWLLLLALALSFGGERANGCGCGCCGCGCCCCTPCQTVNPPLLVKMAPVRPPCCCCPCCGGGGCGCCGCCRCCQCGCEFGGARMTTSTPIVRRRF